MKHCNKCDTTKDYSDFFKDVRRSDGYQSTCKKCKQAEIQIRRDRMKPARLSVINKVKDKGCVVCGENDHVVIQMHHWPIPFTELPFGRNSHAETSRGREEFLSNLASCVPICANCHLKFHAGHVIIPEGSSLSREQLDEWLKDAEKIVEKRWS